MVLMLSSVSHFISFDNAIDKIQKPCCGRAIYISLSPGFTQEPAQSMSNVQVFFLIESVPNPFSLNIGCKSHLETSRSLIDNTGITMKKWSSMSKQMHSVFPGQPRWKAVGMDHKWGPFRDIV